MKDDRDSIGGPVAADGPAIALLVLPSCVPDERTRENAPVKSFVFEPSESRASPVSLRRPKFLEDWKDCEPEGEDCLVWAGVDASATDGVGDVEMDGAGDVEMDGAGDVDMDGAGDVEMDGAGAVMSPRSGTKSASKRGGSRAENEEVGLAFRRGELRAVPPSSCNMIDDALTSSCSLSDSVGFDWGGPASSTTSTLLPDMIDDASPLRCVK